MIPKFRGYIPKLNELVPIFDIKYNANLVLTDLKEESLDGHGAYNLDEVELMEITPFVERHEYILDVPIYEGDIVQKYDCIFPDEEGRIVAVKFIRKLMDFNIDDSSQYKILGNIYENPELLEDK